MLKLPRSGAVGFIDWLDACYRSVSFGIKLAIPRFNAQAEISFPEVANYSYLSRLQSSRRNEPLLSFLLCRRLAVEIAVETRKYETLVHEHVATFNDHLRIARVLCFGPTAHDDSSRESDGFHASNDDQPALMSDV
jgi:hypothetical protein